MKNGNCNNNEPQIDHYAALYHTCSLMRCANAMTNNTENKMTVVQQQEARNVLAIIISVRAAQTIKKHLDSNARPPRLDPNAMEPCRIRVSLELNERIHQMRMQAIKRSRPPSNVFRLTEWRDRNEGISCCCVTVAVFARVKLRIR